MISYEYIRDNTNWVIRLVGHRVTCTGADLEDTLKGYASEEIRDYDIATWQGQLKDLQEFYKAYEYVNYVLNEKDVFYIEDFYKKWIKDPSKYNPEHRPIISTLRKELEALELLVKQNPKLNIKVINYDKHPLGNHWYHNWKSAIELIDYDFDVVEIKIDTNDVEIIIQEDKYELINEYDSLANSAAIRNMYNSE